MRAYFVTGTDTGVGKTTVATALLAAASARGLRTACMKPLESGCPRSGDGLLQPQDAMRLQSATNLGQSLDSICLYRFEEPVAPGVAARREGVAIELLRIERQLDSLRRCAPDLVLVEGAGGALVPLGSGGYAIDLAVRLDIPVLIVARPGLGTINHTLLTVEAAERRGIDVAGVILCCRDAATPESLRLSNIEEISRTGVRILGTLPPVEPGTIEELARAAEQSLDLRAIFSR